MALLNNRLISEEIDTILAHVLGKFLVQGSPTKHGGLRFLDIDSAKTFGFERSQEHEDGNLLIISAPLSFADKSKGPKSAEPSDEVRQAAQTRLEQAVRNGPYADRLQSVRVRPSSDPGKKRKMFLEVQYFIPTAKLVNDDAILKYAQKHGISNTSEAVKKILREYIVPMAKESMDHLIQIVRQEP